MVREMAWYDAYLTRGGVDRSANTTPGNKKGGLSNIVEKAMGSIVKSGSAPISGVLAPGEKLRQKGLVFRGHAGQRLHLRHPATGRGHEPACVHYRARHALRAGRGAGDQGGDAQRPGAALARPDGSQRRHDRRRLGLHRGGGLGTLPSDAGCRQRPQEDLGRTLEAAQRSGGVQPRAGDLSRTTDDLVSLELMMKAMKAKSGGESKKKKMSSSQNVDVTEITRSQRYREGQEDQLGALGLVVNMIALWNTIYMEAVLEQGLEQ